MGLFDVFKKKKPAPAKRPPVRPLMRPGMPPHPEPQADNNFIIVILDSCRYDSFMTAAPKVITKLGKPDSLRVTYQNYSQLSTVREWICLDHDGIAGRKARKSVR